MNEIEVSFKQFLDIIKNRFDSFPRTKMISYPQSFYCLNGDGDIGLDKIYHFENLEDLEKDFNVKLPYKNMGSYDESEYFNSYKIIALN